MHCVYKFVEFDEVIYIGKSDGPNLSRISDHGHKGDNISKDAWPQINHADIYYTILNNSVMTDVVESELIRRYNPRYNKAKKSDWSGLEFPEPNWLPFRINGKRIKRTDAEYVKPLSEKSMHEQMAELNNVIESQKVKISSLIQALESAKESLEWEREQYDKKRDFFKEWMETTDLLNNSHDLYNDLWSKYLELYDSYSILRKQFDESRKSKRFNLINKIKTYLRIK